MARRASGTVKPAPRPERVAAFRVGISAESRAAAFLIAKGYRILARRFRTPVGEIDIVAGRRNTLVFVEVKARNTSRRRRRSGHRPQQAAHRCRGRILAFAASRRRHERNAVRCRAGRARQDAASHRGGVRCELTRACTHKHATSAFGGKADMVDCPAKCRLLTQSDIGLYLTLQ